MIRVGLQIPFFDFPDVGVDQLFESVAAQAQAAEANSEQVQARLLDAGIDDLTLNLPVNGHDPDIIALAAETLRPLLYGR